MPKPGVKADENAVTAIESTACEGKGADPKAAREAGSYRFTR
jgi:hypothetical protein